MDTRGGLVPDARCNAMSRPDSDAFCDAGPCVTNTWLISQWGEVNELFKSAWPTQSLSILSVQQIVGLVMFTGE